MKSLQGKLLIASPHMADPNFARTVILLIQHSDEGAFGVVLNRALDKTVRELWAEVEEPPCDNQQHLNLGGPVSGPLMALHDDAGLHVEAQQEAMEVLPGVFFAHEKTQLSSLVQKTKVHFKMFIGHSGWGEGQLESELKQGAWLTLPATAELVFFEEERLWSVVTRQVGGQFYRDVLKIKGLPKEPGMN